MSTQYRRELYRWIYEQEQEHLDRLDSADTLLTGVLAVLGGVGLYYLKLFSLPSSGFPIHTFKFLAVLFGVLYVAAIACMVLSIWPKTKAMLGLPKDFDDYEKGLHAHHSFSSEDNDDIDEQVDNDLDELIREQVIEVAQTNRKFFAAKLLFQTITKYCIAGAVVLMLVNGIPTYFAQIADDDRNVQKIDMIEFENEHPIPIKVSKEDEQSVKGKAPGATPAPAAGDSEAPAGATIPAGPSEALETES